MKRKKQRDFLVKSVFAHFFQIELSLNDVFESIIDNFAQEKVAEADHEKYLDPLITQISQNQANFQQLISKHLKATWKIERLPWLDVAILEVAIAEMQDRDEIPFDITVNEAVDLAKAYSTEKSASFVNGILVSIYEEISKSKDG